VRVAKGNKWIGKHRQLRAPSPDQTVSRRVKCQVDWICCQSVRQRSSFLGAANSCPCVAEAASRVTIDLTWGSAGGVSHQSGTLVNAILFHCGLPAVRLGAGETAVGGLLNHAGGGTPTAC
jgi:hypothetical protein